MLRRFRISLNDYLKIFVVLFSDSRDRILNFFHIRFTLSFRFTLSKRINSIWAFWVWKQGSWSKTCLILQNLGRLNRSFRAYLNFQTLVRIIWHRSRGHWILGQIEFVVEILFLIESCFLKLHHFVNFIYFLRARWDIVIQLYHAHVLLGVILVGRVFVFFNKIRRDTHLNETISLLLQKH